MANSPGTNLPMSPKKVNLRWAAFAREYVKNGGNGARAYKKHFNCKTLKGAASHASALLKRPEVQEMINREQEAVISLHNIKTDAIANELLGVIERAKESGDEYAMMKALDMLNKMTGAYNHKQEIDLRAQGVVINYINPDEKKKK
jgi:phage terminase small subunit